MILLVPFSLILPLIAAFLFLWLLWPRQSSNRPHFFLKSILSLGLGLGVLSCIHFTWLVLLENKNISPFSADSLTFLALIILFSIFIKKRNRPIQSRSNTKPFKASKTFFFLAGMFFLLLSVSIIGFILLSICRPHGRGDAFGIWNLRARFLFQGSDHWDNAFSMILNWSHPDYPLLLPAAIARIWSYLNKDYLVVPQTVAFLFTYSTVGLLIFSLSILRGRTQGFLAGIVLLSTNFFLNRVLPSMPTFQWAFFF